MSVRVSYPGVYVQEVPSGVRTIVGVSTSIAVFIGRTVQGTLNKPTLCLNFSDFIREFADDSRFSDLARSVRLFFQNGGTQCYVVRIANGAEPAKVMLKSEAAGNLDVVQLTAKDAGLIGNTIRAAVTYNGLQPESTFNLELFRWVSNASGQLVKQDQELWSNLSMDPLSPGYAPTFLTQNSQLVDAALADGAPVAGEAYSQSGRPVAYDATDATANSFINAWAARFGSTSPVVSGATTNQFQISVAGSSFVTVNLRSIDVVGIPAGAFNVRRDALATRVQNAINDALPAGTTVQVSIETGPTPPAAEGTASGLLRIRSTTGDVVIRPATSNDLAVPLMLGTAQGGLEVSRYAALRPAPTGITFKAITDVDDLAVLLQNAFNTITINGTPVPLGTSLQTVGATTPMYKDAFSSSNNDHNDGVREKLSIIQTAINNFAASHSGFNWKAEVWGSRLAIIPTDGADNSIGMIATSGAGGTELVDRFTTNVRYYSLGSGATAGLQATVAPPASDGSKPLLSDYANAYQVIDKEVDLFNLLILPTDKDYTPAEIASLWGSASIFCQQRRSFLLIDPPAWRTVQEATNPATGVNSLRIGLVRDHSAIFYPRLIINENGLKVPLGPSGAIAGLMARIDSNRGVWKAPAGIEADIRGVVGLEYRFSDPENGVLNPRGINTLRIFPNGVVNWGARTMDGDDDFTSEYKYIPIRRLALLIEESLYRGLKFAVFEPNDEPLWAQIRLAAGAFMNNLFRQGAFQGQKARDAYFVKVDSETTTQNDINLGIVNVVVGFAPLKPAEFVVITIQQLAGQVQT
jgi:uncharacterized protein